MFNLPKLRSGEVGRNQQIIDTKAGIGSSYDKFKQQMTTLTPDDVAYVRAAWEGKFKKLFAHGSLGAVAEWLINVDYDSGSADTSQMLITENDHRDFVGALNEIVPFVDDCNQALFAV